MRQISAEVVRAAERDCTGIGPAEEMHFLMNVAKQ